MMAEVMKAHIIVGSVCCVTGLIKSEKMSLSAKFFILDEANRVMDPKRHSPTGSHVQPPAHWRAGDALIWQAEFVIFIPLEG